MSKKLFWMVALLGAMMVALTGCDNLTNYGTDARKVVSLLRLN